MRRLSKKGTTSYGRVALVTSVALATYAVQPDIGLSDSSATFDVDPNAVEGEVAELETRVGETSSLFHSELLEDLEEEVLEGVMDKLGGEWMQRFEQASTRAGEETEQILREVELMQRFEDQRKRVELLDGRHHPEGDVATDDAIEEALSLIDTLYHFQIVPAAVNSTVDSNILFEFVNGELYDSIELLGDGTFIHTSMRPEEGVHARTVSLEDTTVVKSMSEELAHVYSPK